MLKRFAAILFVLTIAGNVWAGICDCIEGSDHPRSSCCDRKSSERDAVSAKPCCDEECGETSLVNVHRIQSDSSLKLPLPRFVGETVNREFCPFALVQTSSTGFDKKLHIWHAQIPRPPNLYIRHQSFLI